MKRTRLLIIVSFLLLFFLAIVAGEFSFNGEHEGLYMLKGTEHKLFELKDRLQLADYERLIARVEFEALYDRWRSKEKSAQGKPYLKYSWHEEKGGGYFISFLPDGTKFLACFGRAVDAAGNPVKGLFPGGGLPGYHYESAGLKTSETGIVFFDGKEWQHLRYKAEEALLSQADPLLRLEPNQWEFMGSKILFASQFRLALKSSHLAKAGGVPVSIDRYLIYHAGDRFFTRATRLTNSGTTTAFAYQYSCGNEPARTAIIAPSQIETIVQTIGMAGNDPQTGTVCRPAAGLHPDELSFFLSR